jgi:hypothetical protein
MKIWTRLRSWVEGEGPGQVNKVVGCGRRLIWMHESLQVMPPKASVSPPWLGVAAACLGSRLDSILFLDRRGVVGTSVDGLRR